MVGHSKPSGVGLRMQRSHYAANALHYGAKAMHAWVRLIQLARASWPQMDELGWYRPLDEFEELTSPLDLRDDFWQLPQGLDLRSAVGHRAKNLSGIALKEFILKISGVWITSIRWVRIVNGLGWARPRFARLDLDIANFDLHVRQDLQLRSRHCPAPDFSLGPWTRPV